MAKDYYAILGVDPDAGVEQIKSAYRRKAKNLHPDHFAGGSKPFRDVKEAYDVLGDSERRLCYDKQVAREAKGRCRPRRSRPEPMRQRRGPIEPLVPDRGQASRWDPFTPSSDFHLNVSLTREQALYGGRLRVWVPVQVPCPSCQGQGGDWFFRCLRCGGSGVAAREYPIEISFPRGVRDGATGRISLREAGLSHVTLTLHFRIREW